MTTSEKIELCDKVLRKLEECNSIRFERISDITGFSGMNDLRSIINTLSDDGLIIEYIIGGRSDSIEITSLGMAYGNSGYKKFLKDKKSSIIEPLKHYRTTRITAVLAIIIAAISLIVAITASLGFDLKQLL